MGDARTPSHGNGNLGDAAGGWIGLDVGGANLKAAHPNGEARTLPFELWKRREDLPRMLATLTRGWPGAGGLAVTMTAELCDCYPTKADGVLDVTGAVERVAGGRPVRVWGLDGAFHAPEDVRGNPRLAAAANWLALAARAALLAPEGPGLLIDIGSTTTDLIPLMDGAPRARGRTDTERLQTGELVYAGARRTPVSALATELTLRGVATGLAAELFATTADVYVLLGEIAEDAEDRRTADGRPLTVEGSRDRMARMVGADRTELELEDAVELARGADFALFDRLLNAGKKCCVGVVGRPRTVVVSGSGEFLARRLASRLMQAEGRIVGLREAWGEVASSSACAYAVMELARERLSGAGTGLGTDAEKEKDAEGGAEGS